MGHIVAGTERESRQLLERGLQVVDARVDMLLSQVVTQRQVLMAYNPRAVLERGYAMVRGKVAPGSMITIERKHDTITAEVKNVKTN
jgi:exonuclease VII large subunit